MLTVALKIPSIVLFYLISILLTAGCAQNNEKDRTAPTVSNDSIHKVHTPVKSNFPSPRVAALLSRLQDDPDFWKWQKSALTYRKNADAQLDSIKLYNANAKTSPDSIVASVKGWQEKNPDPSVREWRNLVQFKYPEILKLRVDEMMDLMDRATIADNK